MKMNAFKITHQMIHYQELAVFHGHLLAIAMAAEGPTYRHGNKTKRLDTPAGTVTVPKPKTAGHAPGRSLHPRVLTRGCQSQTIQHKVAAQMTGRL